MLLDLETCLEFDKPSAQAKTASERVEERSCSTRGPDVRSSWGILETSIPQQ
jgi:hypothetical protein